MTRQPGEVVSIIVWNVKAGRPWPHVRNGVTKLLARQEPDRLVLLEAGGYTRALRRRFRKTHRIVRRGSDVVILAPRDLPRPRTRLMVHLTPWVGPHQGRVKRGRRWLRENIDGLTVVYVHRTPGGPSGGILTRGLNRPAWEVEHRRLVRLAGRVGPLLILGDQNASPHDDAPTSPRSLASQIGGRLIRTGLKVDYGITRGAGMWKPTNLARHGSDHRAVRYDRP